MVNRGSPAPNAPNKAVQFFWSFIHMLAGLFGIGQHNVAIAYAGSESRFRHHGDTMIDGLKFTHVPNGGLDGTLVGGDSLSSPARRDRTGP